MSKLLRNDKDKIGDKKYQLSIFVILVSLFLIDTYFVKRVGNYVIIGDTALTIRDIFILFMFTLALIALMRPMEHKKFQMH